MNDVFRAGVAPGGLTMDYEIKVMICYLLKEAGKPIPASTLIEIFVEEGIGNYFEVASAASSLVHSGHIQLVPVENEESLYEVTPVGISAVEAFANDLPLALREKAVAAVQRALTLREYKSQNRTSVQRVDDGYQLTLTIKDVGSDLLSLTILLPDVNTCHQMETHFLRDPALFYKGVVALLTGNYDRMGTLLNPSSPESPS